MIVVGAGVAGMAATGELARAGFSVLLLEARDRVGGRVFTDRRRGWPGPVELGAEFVHDGNDPFWRLMRRHGLRTRRIPPRHWRFNGAALEPINDVAAAIERVTRRIDAARMRGWSFADFLRFKARTIADADRELASGFVEGFEAAPLDEMSAPALEGETLQDEKQFVLPAGYDSIITALQKDWRGQPVTLHLRTPVHAIEWRRGRVDVQAGNRGFSAAAAVVTLPLGVLQAQSRDRGAVRFIPALRDKARVLSAMRMGHVIRISVRIDGRKWDGLLPARLARIGRAGFGFIHSRMTGIPVWWNLSAASVLTGWAGGPAALALANRPPPAIRESALASLARVLGVRNAVLRGAVADWATHNWSQDPFARGAYSFISAGQERAAEHLRKGVSDTLYFAGEATAGGGETGTVHGALASGLRAAAELSRALRLNAGTNSRRRARRRPR